MRTRGNDEDCRGLEIFFVVVTTPVRSCFGGLIFKSARPHCREVVARYRPASKCSFRGYAVRTRSEVPFGATTTSPVGIDICRYAYVAIPTVADYYEIVIGVDTHAAHALCVVTATTGAAEGQSKFS
ncbi:hypothetical protein H351_30705 (plasmid) [Rhodococcus erythropolis R138]|nr:hypothetical protein H351_30705 [Rhodococcus erythropolis R138]